MKKYLKIFFRLLILLISFNCLLQLKPNLASQKKDMGENDITKTIEINIDSDEYYLLVGENRFFYMSTIFNDNESNYFNSSDIEEKTLFKTTFTTKYDPIVSYDITCRIRKRTNGTLVFICVLNEDLTPKNYYVYLNGTSFFYKSYEIIIKPSTRSFILRIIDTPLFFLSAYEQAINIEENKETYELKFKIEEYDANGLLYLFSNYSFIPIDKCSIEGTYLICEIVKIYIEEVLQYNNQKFDVYAFHNTLGRYKIGLIDGIIINDKPREKKDIYVRITNLVRNITGRDNFIAYNTNVTEVSNFISGRFEIKREDNEHRRYITCYLKKDGDSPLLFLCHWNYYYYNYNDELGEILNETIINNTNINYNFFIQPVKNNEKFSLNKITVTPYFSFPKVVNFNLNKTYVINLAMYPLGYRKTKLNLNLRDLDCDIFNEYVLRCYVNRKYFRNEKSGYYHIYQNISIDEYSTFYEFSPLQVIIPNDDISYDITYINIISEFDGFTVEPRGILYFVIDNNETDIFDSSDLENTEFTAEFIGFDKNDYYYYNAECKLYKLNINKNISIICRLNETLKKEYQKMTINEASLNYKNYNISFILNNHIFVRQVNYSFPFLYSEEQNITIDEENQEYYLSFRIFSYNNEDIFLYISTSYFAKSAKLDCEKNMETLNCKISKQKLDELMTINIEQSKIAYLNNNLGNVIFNYTGNVTLNHYNITNKVDIYVTLTRLLNSNTDFGIPIAYETNVTSLEDLNTYEFLDTAGLAYINCYFRKIKTNPLLLLCLYKPGGQRYSKNLYEEMILENIHYKYNFRIQPYKVYINIKINETGTSIFYAKPEELNFKFQDSNIIGFTMDNLDYANNIALVYKDSNYSTKINNLDCDNLVGLKKCKVSISHFLKQNYKENGYCYVYHSYYENDLKIDYGVSPIQVTLPNNLIVINILAEEDSNIKLICQNERYLCLLIIMIIIGHSTMKILEENYLIHQSS